MASSTYGPIHTAIINGLMDELYDRTNKYPHRDGMLPLQFDSKPKDILAPFATYRARSYGRITICAKIEHLLVFSEPPHMFEKFQYHEPDMLEQILQFLEQETI